MQNNILNLKNIVVGILTLLIIALMALTASRGGAYHGGEHGKVIKDIDKQQASSMEQDSTKAKATLNNEEKDELKAIKDKAGSVGHIRVSVAYKSKCAACHGADGSGMQDGRKLIGPKLYGQSSEKIYQDLIDFKAGKKPNVIMEGLLINTSEEELKKYAEEIGAFSSAAQN